MSENQEKHPYDRFRRVFAFLLGEHLFRVKRMLGVILDAFAIKVASE